LTHSQGFFAVKTSRARIIADADVQPFTWEPLPPAAARGALSIGHASAVARDHVVRDGSIRDGAIRDGPVQTDGTVSAFAPPPVAIDTDAMMREHQARLATLERDAFAKGYAQGERVGVEAGGKRAEAMLRRVAQTIEELSALKTSLLAQTERQTVQLALALARKIVHREISLDPELVAAMAHVALERLGDATPATIRLHPDDYTVVTRDSERWSSRQVRLLSDPSVTRGGCYVESEFGSIDASLERQFDELSRGLFGEERQRPWPQDGQGA